MSSRLLAVRVPIILFPAMFALPVIVSLLKVFPPPLNTAGSSPLFSAVRMIVPPFALKLPLVKFKSSLNVILPVEAVRVVPVDVTSFGLISTSPLKVLFPLVAMVRVFPLPFRTGML